MELHQLRYFAKVAQLGSFTRAAEACSVSQPSLSQQIIKLERDLGRPLFERLGKRILLTEAGHRLKPLADQVLRLVEEVKDRIDDDQDAGRLVVAAPPTVVPYFLTRVLSEFTRRFPKAQVEVVEEVTASIVRKCLDFEIDLAVLPLPIGHHDLRVEPLFEEELLVLLPAGHPLAKKAKVTLKDLQDEPFILLNDAHCLTGSALGFCQQRRFRPIITSRVNQLATIQELVSLGQGVSLVPAMARAADASTLRVYRSLAGERPTRTLGLVRQSHRIPSPLADQFMRTIHELSREADVRADAVRT